MLLTVNGKVQAVLVRPGDVSADRGAVRAQLVFSPRFRKGYRRSKRAERSRGRRCSPTSRQNMAFDVEVTDLARNDIDDAVTYIAQGSQAAAAKWKIELQALILSLQEMPGRFPIVPEAAELQVTYRSVVHYSHPVVFRIDDEKNVVYIVRVYHGARRPFKRGDARNPEVEA